MPDDDKKLQYLKRGDVKTMEKDVTQLREQEAGATREKIAQLRTEEEIKKAADLSAEALAKAKEREMAEVETKKKEDESAKLKAEREGRAASAEATATEKEEDEKEKLRAQFREAQLKEEEERRKFLEEVAEKAGEAAPAPERPMPPPPIPTRPESETNPLPEPQIIPPPLPEAPKKPFKFPLPKIQLPKVQLPKVNLPKVEGYFPTRPSIFEKVWIRIVISLFILAILATLITFWYWYFMVRPTAPTPTTIIQKIETTAPEELKITQGLIGAGYYFPNAPRIIDTIIIHSGFNTSNVDPYSMEGIIQSYKKAGVATHYLISRDGGIFQLAPDYAIAYHAGAGKMPDGRIGVNNFSIGVSLVYQETESPNDAQYQSLSWLVKKLQSQYNIPSENILGYKDVAPEKTTPWNFDWERLKLLFSSSASPSTSLGADFLLGQLFIVGFDGLELTPQLEDFLKTVHPGGVILFKKNIESAPQVKKLIQDLQKISLEETGLPLLVAIDQEGGAVSRASFIKEKTSQAEIENSDQAYGVGFGRGKELKELGINLNLAPVLDLTQDGDFLRERSFQKNLGEAGALAKALISGQKAAGILTAIKHFPGYGGIPLDPEENLAALTLIPAMNFFKEIMRASPEIVMAANIVYSNIDNQMPITFSPKGVAFIKEKVGGAPLIITDDLLQNSLLQNFSLNGVATLPIKAGVDMLLLSGPDAEVEYAILAARNGVQSGYIPKQLIDKAVSRIIKLKQDM